MNLALFNRMNGKLTKPSFCMAQVEKCSSRNCVYFDSNKCHAQAITVGEGMMTKCETYLASLVHVGDTSRTACVGACKVASCAHNEDFQCRSKQVRMGQINGGPGCIDYVPRAG